ncbi:MAG: hypothetical protein ACRDBR_01870 [Metamycoplasmataceae bacterium]
MKKKVSFLKWGLFPFLAITPLVVVSSCDNGPVITDIESRAYWNTIKNSYNPTFKNNSLIDLSLINKDQILKNLNNSINFLPPEKISDKDKKLFNSLSFEIINVAFSNVGEKTTNILVKVSFNGKIWDRKIYSLNSLQNYNANNITPVSSSDNLKAKIKNFYVLGFDNFLQTLSQNINTEAQAFNNISENKLNQITPENIINNQNINLDKIIIYSFNNIYRSSALVESFEEFSIAITNKVLVNDKIIKINFTLNFPSVNIAIMDEINCTLTFNYVLPITENYDK